MNAIAMLLNLNSHAMKGPKTVASNAVAFPGVVMALATALFTSQPVAAMARHLQSSELSQTKTGHSSLMAQTVMPRPSQGFAGQNSGAFGFPAFLGIMLGGYGGGGTGQGDDDSSDDDEGNAAPAGSPVAPN